MLKLNGARDVNSFRSKVESTGSSPSGSTGSQPDDSCITFEGLFNEYYFDTNARDVTETLVPNYQYASSKHPLSGKQEHYLYVGLNSKFDGVYKHGPLDFVVVLDISGSMNCPFDGQGTRYSHEGPAESSKLTKIQVAKDSLLALLPHLNPQDRFALVTFNSNAHLVQPLRQVDMLDMVSLSEKIKGISASGCTDLSAGYELAHRIIADNLSTSRTTEEMDHRIVFLTDMHPNQGETSDRGLFSMAKKWADKEKIYSTFIGVGLDFDTQLVEFITKIKGANYFSVHSAQQFRRQLDTEFEYFVTPTAFDMLLLVENTRHFEIGRVYGNPEADKATGILMTCSSLFPSDKNENGEVQGGGVLLKLRPLNPSQGDHLPESSMDLRISYKEKGGQLCTSTQSVQLDTAGITDGDYYACNGGVRKCVVLCRYAKLMKKYMRLKNCGRGGKQPELAKFVEEQLKPFRLYFEREMKEIGDRKLSAELDIMDKIIYSL